MSKTDIKNLKRLASLQLPTEDNIRPDSNFLPVSYGQTMSFYEIITKLLDDYNSVLGSVSNVTLEEIPNGYKIIFEDVDGETREAEIYNGQDGQDGEQGPQGEQGPTGPAGPAGPQGPEGPEGPQGPAGAQGSQGPAGEQGPAGPQGETGPQGPQGIQGETGAQGPTGPQGPQGIQGETGPQGPAGQNGTDGTDGTDGVGITSITYKETDLSGNYIYTITLTDGSTYDITAPIGPQGATGPTGATGATGATGPQGPQGIQGETGPQGPAGQNGTNGTDGTDGTDGVGITSITYKETDVSGNYIYTITLTDGSTYDITAPIGPQGATGAAGATGPAGPGVPTGGTAGQVLSKIDGTDYNTEWVTPSGGGSTRTAISESTLQAAFQNIPSTATSFKIIVNSSGSSKTIAAANYELYGFSLDEQTSEYKIEKTTPTSTIAYTLYISEVEGSRATTSSYWIVKYKIALKITSVNGSALIAGNRYNSEITHIRYYQTLPTGTSLNLTTYDNYGNSVAPVTDMLVRSFNAYNLEMGANKLFLKMTTVLSAAQNTVNTNTAASTVNGWYS